MIGNPPWGQTKPPVGYGVDWGDPISRGLVGCWLFNEGAGNKVYDIAKGNTGTLTNGPLWVPGKLGQTLKFDGASSYVSIGASDVDAPCSASMWVYKPALSSFTSVALFDSSAYSFRGEQYNGTRAVGVTKYGVADYLFSPEYQIPLLTLVNLTLVISGSVAILYANGVQKGTISGVDIKFPRTDIGRNNPNVFNGLIDNARIYNRALSAQEIMRLYTEPFAGIQTPSRRFISPAAAGGAAPWANRINNLIGTGVNVS